MSSDLAALMAVRIVGIASVDRIASFLVIDAPDAKARLDDLVSRDLLKFREGRLCGYQLVTDGLKALDKLLAEEGLRGSEEFRECYDRFLVGDRLVKSACAAGERDFDAGVDALIAAQDKVRVAVRKVVRCAPRYAAYHSRLEACIARLVDGERAAFHTPQAESYHQVWWEMHTDLAATLDVEKEV